VWNVYFAYFVEMSATRERRTANILRSFAIVRSGCSGKSGKIPMISTWFSSCNVQPRSRIVSDDGETCQADFIRQFPEPPPVNPPVPQVIYKPPFIDCCLFTSTPDGTPTSFTRGPTKVLRDGREWRGNVGMPKGGRIRYVPLTKRLVVALNAARHLRRSTSIVRE
jgi:hypothetical protein